MAPHGLKGERQSSELRGLPLGLLSCPLLKLLLLNEPGVAGAGMLVGGGGESEAFTSKAKLKGVPPNSVIKINNV